MNKLQAFKINTAYILSGFRAFILCLVMIVAPAHASSYIQLDVNELVYKSELIFEGRVLNIEYKIPNDQNYVHTYVTFEIDDLIFGDYSNTTIELRYPGGINVEDDTLLTISDMIIPKMNDHGLYFVKSTQKQYVHPLTGWNQGMMLIHQDQNGTYRLFSSEDKPITAIQILSPENENDYSHLTSPVSRGIVTSTLMDTEKAMSVEEAKTIIHKLLAGE